MEKSLKVTVLYPSKMTMLYQKVKCRWLGASQRKICLIMRISYHVKCFQISNSKFKCINYSWFSFHRTPTVSGRGNGIIQSYTIICGFLVEKHYLERLLRSHRALAMIPPTQFSETWASWTRWTSSKVTILRALESELFLIGSPRKQLLINATGNCRHKGWGVHLENRASKLWKGSLQWKNAQLYSILKYVRNKHLTKEKRW